MYRTIWHYGNVTFEASTAGLTTYYSTMYHVYIVCRDDIVLNEFMTWEEAVDYMESVR